MSSKKDDKKKKAGSVCKEYNALKYKTIHVV